MFLNRWVTELKFGSPNPLWESLYFVLSFKMGRHFPFIENHCPKPLKSTTAGINYHHTLAIWLRSPVVNENYLFILVSRKFWRISKNLCCCKFPAHANNRKTKSCWIQFCQNISVISTPTKQQHKQEIKCQPYSKLAFKLFYLSMHLNVH